MRAGIVVGWTLAALLIAAGLAPAQGLPDDGVPQANVAPGEKIVLTTSDGERVEGRLRTITPDLVTLDLRKGLGMIEMRRVNRIVVKDSIRNGLLMGLAIGAGAGVAGGLVMNAICVNETGGCLGDAAVLGLAGAAGGAAIGAGLDGLQHRTAFERRESWRGVGLVIDLGRGPRTHASSEAPQFTAHVSVAPAAYDPRIYRAGVGVRGGVGFRW